MARVSEMRERGRRRAWGLVVGTRVGRSAIFAIATLALSVFVLAPASAQASGSWTLGCNGNASGSVSWNWLLDGAPIAGGGGSAACSGTMTSAGTSARPSNANGFTATLNVSAGADTTTKTGTKSFAATQSFQMKLTAGAQDRVRVCIPPERNNCFWANLDENANFSFQG